MGAEPDNLEIVLKAYDLGPVRAVVALRGGRMARSWRVSARAGDFVLRRAEPDLPGRLPLAPRQRLLLHLADHLPEVPRLIPNARGETVTEAGGRRYELLTFLPDETLDEAAGVREMPPDTLKAAGRLLARYHRAAGTAPVPPPDRAAPGEELAARWARLRDRLAIPSVGAVREPPPPRADHDRMGVPSLPEIAAAESTIQRWVRELEAFWSGSRSPVSPSPRLPVSPSSAPLPWLWAHGDYTPYNLVYRDGTPAGLLDFGAVQWAPAAYDVAIALLAFPDPAAASALSPTNSPMTEAPTSIFLSGYESERPLTKIERAALPMLARHRRVIAILWIAEECRAGREELRGKLGEYLAE